ncbi:hypothetical protein CBOM_01205 [Ceraceosorus bombacis]|uniref:Uncharacterized protein n=1 Tax=Ceraceosorus bombacis TaxID=401625 RepID=A0A0P1BBQ2_9BASI|nr:hypothetical protein CBOM_01205 [Ceraceosorus bombacis]
MHSLKLALVCALLGACHAFPPESSRVLVRRGRWPAFSSKAGAEAAMEIFRPPSPTTEGASSAHPFNNPDPRVEHSRGTIIPPPSSAQQDGLREIPGASLMRSPSGHHQQVVIHEGAQWKHVSSREGAGAHLQRLAFDRPIRIEVQANTRIYTPADLQTGRNTGSLLVPNDYDTPSSTSSGLVRGAKYDPQLHPMHAHGNAVRPTAAERAHLNSHVMSSPFDRTELGGPS